MLMACPLQNADLHKHPPLVPEHFYNAVPVGQRVVPIAQAWL